MRFAHVGGNWNNSTNAGLFYWNLNNTSSNTNVNIGSQTLISIFILASYFPHHLVKIRRKKQRLVGFSKIFEANKKD
jgi:hypothetical protein